MVVTSKIISLNGSKKEDKMFIPHNGFTFEDLIKWVYRNCPGERKIIIENDSVSAQYEDRVETYYLRNCINNQED